MKNEHGLNAKEEAFAVAVAVGATQAEAYRRAFPVSKEWKPETLWRKSSLLAGTVQVKARISALLAKAAAESEVTVERITREASHIAFVDRRKLMSWGPRGVRLVPSTKLTDAEAACVAEVSQTAGVDGRTIRLKMHDKVRALELLGRIIGAFKEDNKQKGDALAALLAGLPGNVIGANKDAALDAGDDATGD